MINDQLLVIFIRNTQDEMASCYSSPEAVPYAIKLRLAIATELQTASAGGPMKQQPQWFEVYRKCGCISPIEHKKKDLPGYCSTHGTDRSEVHRLGPPAPEEEKARAGK